MWQKNFKRLSIVFLIGCLLLCSCGKESTDSSNILFENRGDYAQTEEIPTTYTVDTFDLNITPAFIPNNDSLQFKGQSLYFQNIPDTHDSTYSIFCKSLAEENAPLQILIDFTLSEQLLHFIVDDTENIYCFLKIDEDQYFFKTYNKEGKLSSEQEITELIPEKNNFYIRKSVMDSNGNVYILCDKSLWLFHPDHQYLKQIDISAPNIMDISISIEGEPYVTYSYNDGIDITLAKLNSRDCKPENQIAISGNGRIFPGITRGLLTFDNKSLYKIDPDTGTYTILLDLMAHFIDSRYICTLWGNSDKEINIITWDTQLTTASDNPVELLRLQDTPLTASNPTSNQEKQIIHLLHSGTDGNPAMMNFVMEFNKQSDKYIVSYEGLEFDNKDEFINYVNTRLVSPDCPDLILFNYYFYQIYAEAEVLADLNPYLEQSITISLDDYLDTVIEPFCYEKAIYGIPNSFYIKSLVGRKSQVKSIHKKEIWPFPFLTSQKETTEGMSVDGFITYLEKNPDVKIYLDGTPSGILRFCLKYSMDSFVDFEKGTCNFTGDDFRNLMLRINNMERTHCADFGEWEAFIKNGEKLLPEMTLSDFYTLSGQELEYRYDLILLGYPSSDGSLKCELMPQDTIGITQKSSQKEGAWEFLEYYLQNYESLSGFSSRKEAFQEAFFTAQTKQYQVDRDGKKVEIPVSQHFYEMDLLPIYALSEEKAKHILAAVENATTVPKEINTIIDIIWEECGGYFYGDKTLDETLHIIQNRAQLYLDENS